MSQPVELEQEYTDDEIRLLSDWLNELNIHELFYLRHYYFEIIKQSIEDGTANVH